MVAGREGKAAGFVAEERDRKGVRGRKGVLERGCFAAV